ncbi:MAG: putative CXXCH cytochrome family protein [Halieaceae bacterium]|jgi:predicted CXXCH cytochrome family protein
MTIPRCTRASHRYWLLLAALIPLSLEAADFLGSASCAGCHQEAHALWEGSHHDLAMQKPDAGSVLGDFDDASFAKGGVTTRFLRRGESYIVHTDGPEGELRDYEVAYVFGVFPLQQYLLPLPGGRLQALSIAWDSRPAEDGGQRWYHLYPDEIIGHSDPLHWTGPYQNWNTRCAECHSTQVEKRYDALSKSFDTRYVEEDVGCEACHGPGSNHVALAQQGQLPTDPLGGFAMSLAQRGNWAFPEGEDIARRQSPLGDKNLIDRTQIDSCGRCHARRSTLGDYEYGKPLSDTHRLSLLGAPLYHHDGQILDEDYVYGSFVQSKMHLAGVVCSNCHEPHSNALRAEGNAVCTQCHKAAVFDAPEHHRHAGGSSGAQCANCHMPTTVYMGVDSRRDHSMRIPRPDLSVMIDTPNACNSCHSDKSAQWALDTLHDWNMPPRGTAAHPALAMEALERGDSRGIPRLVDLAGDSTVAPVWRATALEGAAAAASPEALALARSLAGSADPLLRISAVRALQQLPIQQRFSALAPLLGDPVLGVRLEAALGLAPTPLEQVDDTTRRVLLASFEEYLTVQNQHADMPAIQMQLGLFHLARGDFPAAEAAYREALTLNPQLIPARLNLADLLRSQQREDEARTQLAEAAEIAPDSADVMHARGLLEARTGDRSAALDWLGRAAALEQNGARHRFVFAVAQHDFDDLDGALATLKKLHRALPNDEQTLLALANYSAEKQDLGDAQRYARRLLALAPDNRGYRQLAASLGVRN